MRSGPNPYPPSSDAAFLHTALELAQGGLGWTSPNPAVGCVLVRDGAIIGRGFHPHDGGRHAEHEALLSCADPRGVVAYTTLEPCSVDTRTPSCCRLLAEAGVAAVVYGALDSDPRSAGRSATVLAARGIPVRLPQGAGAEDAAHACRRFIDGYTYGKLHSSPFFHLKLALSLDAKLATAGGASQWLSGPVSLGLAHYLRQTCDGILVGYRTVLADNPRLTVRPETMAPYRELAAPARFPVRIVLDPHWTILARLDERAGTAPLALAELDGPFRKHLPRLVLVGHQDELPGDIPAMAGLELVGLPAGRELDFTDLRTALWQLGIRSVLIEGGAGVAQRLLAQRQVDKLSCVYTPRLLGADGLGFSPPLALASVDAGMRLADVAAAVLGEDVLLSGYPE